MTPVREIGTSHKGKADILLIDAPCSGSGVYRRKPDAKWELSEKKLRYYLSTQQELLDSGAELIRPGGYLVYATCSIIPDENEKQINDFLSRHKDFEPASVYDALSHHNIRIPASSEKHLLRILPQDADSDGFFIAKLRRIKTRQ
ncbi:MAG: RsmB/NOP family class I SAM-dependent RNA methyltransferase [Candidatus Marinimicrobia bacterium]|nr:RsmB/NOP family class I SAM-dependent RNA methyltransferase [Candidatus Neomarinimicrobiota bacterium]